MLAGKPFGNEADQILFGNRFQQALGVGGVRDAQLLAKRHHDIPFLGQPEFDEDFADRPAIVCLSLQRFGELILRDDAFTNQNFAELEL